MKLFIVEYIPEDPEYEPWRELAKEMGTQSACSVPLKTGKDVIGALTVHHGQPHIFGEEELQLLEEVAGDISFAIRRLRDRRERYEAERRVAASEKQYRNLVEAMSDGLAMHDEKGVFTYVNDSICEISGYSKDEILGEAVFDFLDDTNGRIFKEKMKLEKKGQREIYELAFTKKDGQKIPMNISPAPLFNEKGHYEGSLAIITDISEKKQLEDQLRQSQKMEAVATLAGGIAHDFNNILASIIGYAELTEQDVADNAPARENLEEVQRGGVPCQGSGETDPDLQPPGGKRTDPHAPPPCHRRNP